MDWDHIAKAWEQFISKAVPTRSLSTEVDPARDVSNRAPQPLGGVHEEARMTPHIPNTHDDRNTFSQHLSC